MTEHDPYLPPSAAGTASPAPPQSSWVKSLVLSVVLVCSWLGAIRCATVLIWHVSTPFYYARVMGYEVGLPADYYTWRLLPTVVALAITTAIALVVGRLRKSRRPPLA